MQLFLYSGERMEWKIINLETRLEKAGIIGRCSTLSKGPKKKLSSTTTNRIADLKEPETAIIEHMHIPALSILNWVEIAHLSHVSFQRHEADHGRNRFFVV